MKDTLNTSDLATLLKRGMELIVWQVPDDRTKKAGLFGAKVYDPDEINPEDLVMEECHYAATITEAINAAVREER